jgi:hypothetical protein
MFNTNNITQKNIVFPYPKKAKTRELLNHRNAKLKIDKPISNKFSQLVNNFLIHQQIPQTPNNLKNLFIRNNKEILSVVSIGGRLVVIIFFKYPGFEPNIPGYETKILKITKEGIANNPSYICALDFGTCQVLDVVQIPGEIKYFNLFREFAAIAYSSGFGDTKNHLVSFALSPMNHKFIQIHTPIDVGENKIHSITINYITVCTGIEIASNGRLIIYCCASPRFSNDLLITFNHFINPNIWKLHKMSVVRGIFVDITKYTQTDYFAGQAEEIDIPPNNMKCQQETNHKVALHIDNPNVYYPVSEIYQQKRLSTNLSTNDYILHSDGRLEIINFDIGRAPLKSINYAWRQIEKIISQYNYPPNKGGIEIIYSTILETPRPISQELVFGECNFTVKNGIQEYQLQPGKIMKYACIKYIHKHNAGYLYEEQSAASYSIEINIITSKFIYSPNGKYLAQIITCSGCDKYYGKMIGVLLYIKTHPGITALGGINPGTWHECSYIETQCKQSLLVNFIPEINYDGQTPGYYLMITNGNQDSLKNTIIHTPSTLADKYCDLFAKTNTQLGQSNIKNIAQFIAADKLRYIDLTYDSKSSYCSQRDDKSKAGYKKPHRVINNVLEK